VVGDARKGLPSSNQRRWSESIVSAWDELDQHGIKLRHANAVNACTGRTVTVRFEQTVCGTIRNDKKVNLLDRNNVY